MKKVLKSIILSSLILFYSCGDKPVDEPFDPTFSVETPLNLPQAGGQGYTFTVEASADVSWSASASSGNDWLTLVSATGKGNGSVVFNLSANDGTSARSVQVTVTASSDRSSDPIPSQVCVVNQYGSDPVVGIDPIGEVEVPAAANAEYTIAVTSNAAWTASVAINSGATGWISVTPTTNTGTGAGEVILNILENTGDEPRVAVVTVATTIDPTVKQTLTITQRKADEKFAIFIPKYTMSANGRATMNISPYPTGAAQNISVEVFSDASGTTIGFAETLSAGDYLINSITFDANPAIIFFYQHGPTLPGCCRPGDTSAIPPLPLIPG